MCQLKNGSIISTNQIDPQSTRAYLHKQQETEGEPEPEGKREVRVKGKAEAYSLWLADDIGDGLGGFGEDGGGVHPLQVHVGRHVQARHPRSLPLPLPPLRNCLRLAAFSSSALLRSLLCAAAPLPLYPATATLKRKESPLLCLS